MYSINQFSKLYKNSFDFKCLLNLKVPEIVSVGDVVVVIRVDIVVIVTPVFFFLVVIVVVWVVAFQDIALIVEAVADSSVVFAYGWKIKTEILAFPKVA